jgi:TonB family protein
MITHLLAWLLSYLFNALWQVPLLFGAVWIASRMLRRLGPQAEHRAWVGALLLQIALPACNFRMASFWNALLNLLPAHGASADSGVRVVFGPASIAGNRLQLPFAVEAGIAIAWACIVLYCALRLGWGLVQTRKFAGTATPADLPGDVADQWLYYCARFRITPPRIAVSSQITAPVAIGFRQGMVLLPSPPLEIVPPGDLDAVLAHELAHIARRDFAKNLVYNLLSLPLAWHPLTWRTRAHLAETRELICDDAAATAVAGRRQYARSLLRLASAFAGQPRLVTLQAVGILDFSSSSALERRIVTLTRKRIPLSTSRRFLLAGACAIFALATCASALALHTDVSAVAPIAETAAHGPITVSAATMTSNKISGENPTYPPEARKKKIQGKVVLSALISKEGTIKELHTLESPSNLLSDSATKAVRTWRYRPYLLNGEPVEVETTINVIYSLGG